MRTLILSLTVLLYGCASGYGSMPEEYEMGSQDIPPVQIRCTSGIMVCDTRGSTKFCSCRTGDINIRMRGF